jgi:O-succinylbenzoic acid--CoA ligase
MNRYLKIGEGWLAKENSRSCRFALQTAGVLRDLQLGESIHFSVDGFSNAGWQGEGKAPKLIFYTGGTTGRPKKVLHCSERICFAIHGFLQQFGPDPMHFFCCLPLYHVSGWMQVERAWESGGTILFGDYRDLLDFDLARNLVGRWISLVPTQLQLLLKSNVACSALRKAKGILLGGAKSSPQLLQDCRREELPVFPCYGMTETAAMFTVLNSHDFLNGQGGVGKCLGHAEIRLGQKSCIEVRTQSICLEKDDSFFDHKTWLATQDVARIDEGGNLHIERRADRIINSGGVKVDPQFVEEVILQSGEVNECLVAGERDEKWGQRMVAYVTPATVNTAKLRSLLAGNLEGASMPKDIFAADRLPLNELGKPRSTDVSKT